MAKKNAPARAFQDDFLAELNEQTDLIIGYARVSTFKQFDDGISVDTQDERICYHAAARGYPKPLMFHDAESGKTLDRRDWETAMRLIRAGRVRKLIVYKLDRLSRSLKDLIELAETLQAHNCELEVIAENISTDNASARLFFHILAALAQWTRETIAENTRNVLAYKREQGEFTGGCPEYGFRTCPSGRVNRHGKEVLLIEPDPDEQKVIRKVQAMRSAGAGVMKIYRALEESGARNRAGTPVTRKQIYRIINRMHPIENETVHVKGQMPITTGGSHEGENIAA